VECVRIDEVFTETVVYEAVLHNRRLEHGQGFRPELE
jgi:hypothetical protein